MPNRPSGQLPPFRRTCWGSGCVGMLIQVLVSGVGIWLHAYGVEKALEKTMNWPPVHPNFHKLMFDLLFALVVVGSGAFILSMLVELAARIYYEKRSTPISTAALVFYGALLSLFNFPLYLV